MRLTDSELRDVLARADEIQRASRQGDEWNAELAAVISAAEEVGLSRNAVVRALNERFSISPTPPGVGSLTWAQSADGKFYVAEVLSATEEGARVRFLRGGEHDVAFDRLRQCAFLPGERIVCNWPWWGEYTGTVVAYDPNKQRVKLTDGWSTKTFPVPEVWLPPAKPLSSRGRTRVYATLVGVGAGVGAIIGSIVTALLTR
jgi:hypothetical protein